MPVSPSRPSVRPRPARAAGRTSACDGRLTGVTLGFHGRGGGALVDLHACEVLHPRLVALFDPLRALLRGLPALRREGSAVLNLLDTGPDLLLRTDGALDATGRAKLAAFAAEHGIPRVAWAPSARRAGGGRRPARPGRDPLRRRGGASAARRLPPGEPGRRSGDPGGGAGRAARTPAGAGRDRGTPRGDRHLELRPRGARARVVAYEVVGGGGRRLGRGGGTGGRADRGGAARPRSAAAPAGGAEGLRRGGAGPALRGAKEQVPLLARARVPRIIYVSCNPAVLARDARTLKEAGYRVLSAVPVDQFLWSPHLGVRGRLFAVTMVRASLNLRNGTGRQCQPCPWNDAAWPSPRRRRWPHRRLLRQAHRSRRSAPRRLQQAPGLLQVQGRRLGRDRPAGWLGPTAEPAADRRPQRRAVRGRGGAPPFADADDALHEPLQRDRSGHRAGLVLFDTGNGRERRPDTGQMLAANMRAAGLRPGRRDASDHDAFPPRSHRRLSR